MTTNIKVFLLETTDTERRELRRYATGPCSCKNYPASYHDASVALDIAPYDKSERHWPRDDPRWPRFCECGYEFEPEDPWQLFTRRLYVRADTGEQLTLNEAPVGACWFAEWYAEHPAYRGSDGRTLVVMTPGGEWIVDSRASNCTRPNENEHKCWVRHGRPEDGSLHVDKNGLTCEAGAGSIVCGAYHGFLHNGHLTNC